MTNVNTLARPYAKAIFELALKQETLQDWARILGILAEIANNEKMKLVLANPLASKKQIESIFFEIAGNSLTTENKNLIYILVSKKRLNILPAILRAYEAYLAEKERTIEIKVVSAYKIDEDRLNKLQRTLENHFKKQIKIEFSIKSTLLGGIIIYAGDQVIDDSILGKLNRLSEQICR
jgi:F-type H+-transporting ATPase subunit delta